MPRLGSHPVNGGDIYLVMTHGRHARFLGGIVQGLAELVVVAGAQDGQVVGSAHVAEGGYDGLPHGMEADADSGRQGMVLG